VMRQSPMVQRPVSDQDSWEHATNIADDIADEVIEETSPGEEAMAMPEPPAPPAKKKPATPSVTTAAAKR